MSSSATNDAASPGPDVRAGDWNEERKPERRRFPHPGGEGTPLRVACTREAFADLAMHVKESLHAEVCGVLVGTVCHDDQGQWLDVRASLRGTAAAQGAGHVTFTQETWTRIHADREARYPKLGIVGWYHSHPGFGVEFSDMDVFIHKNFFAAPGQVALVSDPISGQDAACINTLSGIRYLDRCWVDGRERSLKTPAAATPAATDVPSFPSGRIEALESRIGQLITSLDEIHERVSRFYMVVGMTAVMALVMYLGFSLWSNYATRYSPPKSMSQFSMPLRIGDKDVMVKLEVVGWDVPPELNSIMLQLMRERLAAEEAANKGEQDAKRAKEGAASDHRDPSTAPSPSVPPAPAVPPPPAPSPAIK